MGVYPGYQSLVTQGCVAYQAGDHADCYSCICFYADYGVIFLGTGFVPVVADAHISRLELIVTEF
jgi:hypothetical protein